MKGLSMTAPNTPENPALEPNQIELFIAASQDRDRKIVAAKLDDVQAKYPNMDVLSTLREYRLYGDDVWKDGWVSILDLFLLDTGCDLSGLNKSVEVEKEALLTMLRDQGFYNDHIASLARTQWLKQLEVSAETVSDANPPAKGSE